MKTRQARRAVAFAALELIVLTVAFVALFGATGALSVVARILIALVGLAFFLVVLTPYLDRYVSPPEDEDDESTRSSITGHAIPIGSLCDKCLHLSHEEIDYHLSGHVLLTDGCAVCDHIRDGQIATATDSDETEA